MNNTAIKNAMTIRLDNALPEYPKFVEGIRRAPDRGFRLTKAQAETALRNALRYVPEELHAELAPEFMEELVTRGRIYAYRFRPEGRIYGKSIDEYKGNCIEGRAFQVMMDNNLDFEIALYPYELVTYGETGSVCQNWLQYRLIKKYLEQLTENQTLVVETWAMFLSSSIMPSAFTQSSPPEERRIIFAILLATDTSLVERFILNATSGIRQPTATTPAVGLMRLPPKSGAHSSCCTFSAMPSNWPLRIAARLVRLGAEALSS